MKKVIFISREGYRLPGARVRCYNFARELANRGADTGVLSFSDTLGAFDGEKESSLNLGNKIYYNFKAFKMLLKDKSFIFYIQRLNYHFLGPYLAHAFRRNKIILDLDDWEMRENPRYHLGVYPTSKAHYLTRRLAKESIFCVAASHFLESFLLQFNKIVFYLPSAVDTGLFSPNKVLKAKEKVVFSWIGTFHRPEYIENIAFALDCFKVLRNRYANIFFEIVGDGIFKKDLDRIVSGFYDDHIVLKGWIEPDAIPEYLDGVDVGLFPVLRKTKFNLAKSPTKLFEYMAMAKPTISSAIGEPVSIIAQEENGLLAQTKDEFIFQMERLVKDAALRERLGKNARKTVEDFYSLKVLGNKLREALLQYA